MQKKVDVMITVAIFYTPSGASHPTEQVMPR